MRTIIAGAALCVLLAGCGSPASQSAASASAATAISPASVAPASAPAAPASAADAPGPASGAEPVVTVDNEAGVRVATPAGAAVAVPFGTPQAQARTQLFAALGQPRESTNPDCPWGTATNWTWASGTAYVVNGDLVGWQRGEENWGYTCIAD